VELLLIRHAEPMRVVAGEVAGPADPGLTERGAEQARRLADWLEHEQIDAIVASPLRRARETAAPLAATFGLDPVVIDDISEYDAHSDEYIPIEELRALKDDRWQATVEGRWADVGGVDPAAFQARVVPAIDAIIADHPGQKVAAFSHGGVVNVYLAHVLDTARLLWFHPEYTSISRVHASREGERGVATVNETAHLIAHRATSDEVARR
jgi:probable phosphoglycerate mutase